MLSWLPRQVVLRWMVVHLAVMWISTEIHAAEVDLNGHHFTLPDGFEITVAAKAPELLRPITADFDDQGRLYVSDSSGTNDKVQVQLEQKPHRILRLEDTNGDGVFDKSLVFADKMMFPEGTMWLDGSLYVAAPPSIWKLTDTNGDGVADERSEWFQGKTLTGCANDLHGPYRGPDGWIYWCKGAFAEQIYKIQGRDWKTKASHIFRCRPDGTGIEPVMSGGMDNPVDTVFLPNGDRFFTTTFLVHPGNGQRDGLIHAIYGGVYGKEQGALDGHPRTGELMPVLSHMGAAAPCGLTRYESPAFGDDFLDNLFACQFNLHKVSRHVLTARGSSHESKDSDFVVSTNSDFHPTDIVADADGSLLIVDTGGWYKLCCPSSQLHKPDILGAIYRVRRRDAKPIDDPRGLTIDWSKPEYNTQNDDAENLTPLQRLAGDENRPGLRRRAHERLAQLDLIAKQEFTEDSETKPPVKMHFPPIRVQANGPFVQSIQENLWAWSRVAGKRGMPLIRAHLVPEAHPEIRQVALHLVSLHRDRAALSLVVPLLTCDSAPNRRLAAEVLGRIGDKSQVPALLDAVKLADDRAQEHAITFALIELADPAATRAGLSSNHARTQRVAMIALDQMSGGGLDAKQVLARLESPEPLLKETANWLVGRHPEWGGDLAGWFSKQLSAANHERPVDELVGQLVRHATHPIIQSLLADSATNPSLPVAARKLVLRVMAQAKPGELPATWAVALAKIMTTADSAILRDAVEAARIIPPAKKPHEELRAALRGLSATETLDASTRLSAMAAVVGGLPQVTDEQFALLLGSLQPDRPVVDRSAAADALSRAKLDARHLAQLCEAVKTIGPLELDRLLVPFERSIDEKLGLQLLDALKKATALSSLRPDSLQQKLAKYSPAVQQRIAEVTALINIDAAAQKKHLEELLPTMATGDVRRGQAVFNSSKAACVACHRFGYVGGNAGPDLTRIGGIRTERDLLESILYPSLSFVRSYEPVVIVTTDGRVVNGLVKNESATEVLVITGPNQESRVPRADIEELRPSTVSVMPAGLDKQLTPQELADLVAFLKNAK